MPVTELQVQESLRDLILTLDSFDGHPVVINDWDVLKTLSSEDSPIAIIENSDDFVSRQDTFVLTNNFVVKLTLIVSYREDKLAHDKFRDVRQDVLDNIRDGSRSAGGLPGIDINNITPGTPVSFIFDQYVEPEELDTVIPAFIYQTLLLHCEEF